MQRRLMVEASSRKERALAEWPMQSHGVTEASVGKCTGLAPQEFQARHARRNLGLQVPPSQTSKAASDGDSRYVPCSPCLLYCMPALARGTCILHSAFCILCALPLACLPWDSNGEISVTVQTRTRLLPLTHSDTLGINIPSNISSNDCDCAVPIWFG